ncbi:MAG: hypothetical protein GYA24_11650 [Candidatus Lokiarchaeota archaeon]|nr:hypothetical protein [Candidatus Lokiarchaeota archaeon]
MLLLMIHDLVRSKDKLLRVFLSNLVLTTLNVILIHALNFLYTILDSFSSNLDTVFFNYTIIGGILTFMVFIIIVVFCIAVISNISFILRYIEKRTIDIGIMKATGANETRIVQFFFFAPAVTCLGSFFIALGASSAVMWVTWPVVFTNTSSSSTFLFLLFLGNVLTIIATPAYKISSLFKKKVAENLNQDHNIDSFELRKASLFRNFLRRLGKTILLSYKSLLTRKDDFSRSMLILTCTCLASGLLFTSAFVIQATYSSDLRISVGGDAASRVVVVGNEAMVNFMIDSYRSFYDPDIDPVYLPSMYSNEFYMNRTIFNASLLSNVISGMDWRIVYKAIAREVQGIEPLSPSGYRIWGRSRSCPAVIQGIEWSASFRPSTGFTQQSFGTDGNSIILGDSIAGLIIDNPTFQKIDVQGDNHEIAGQLFDPFNNGFVIYMDPSELWAALGLTVPFYNCVFITMKPGSPSELAARLDQLVKHVNLTYGVNFTARSLEPTFSAIINSTGTIGWVYAGIATLIFIFSILFQQEFIAMTIQHNARDYTIMHLIGMPRKKVARIIHEEFTIVLSLACILAFGLNLIISSLFIIPMPTLPPIHVPLAIFGAIWFSYYISSFVLVKWGRWLRFLS